MAGGTNRSYDNILFKSPLSISVSDGSVFAKNAGFQIFLGQPSEFPLIQVKLNYCHCIFQDYSYFRFVTFPLPLVANMMWKFSGAMSLRMTRKQVRNRVLNIKRIGRPCLEFATYSYHYICIMTYNTIFSVNWQYQAWEKWKWPVYHLTNVDAGTCVLNKEYLCLNVSHRFPWETESLHFHSR